jgi:hypothetical protein
MTVAVKVIIARPDPACRLFNDVLVLNDRIVIAK